MAFCTKCGEENPDKSRFCGRCGELLGDAPTAAAVQPQPARPPPPPYAPPYQQMYYPQYVRRTETRLAFAGGILVLIGGVLALVSSFLGLVLPLAWGGYYYDPFGFWIYSIVCGLLGLVFAIIAIVGGVFAIRKENFGVAIVGAVFCMLSFGGLGISSILGLIGLVFIAVSSHEFR